MGSFENARDGKDMLNRELNVKAKPLLLRVGTVPDAKKRSSEPGHSYRAAKHEQTGGVITAVHIHNSCVGHLGILVFGLGLREVAGILLQQFGGLVESGVGWYRLKISVGFVFLNSDGFEKQGFAIHMDVHRSYFPGVGTHLLLLDSKCSAFVEVTENAAKEFHFAG